MTNFSNARAGFSASGHVQRESDKRKQENEKRRREDKSNAWREKEKRKPHLNYGELDGGILLISPPVTCL